MPFVKGQSGNPAGRKPRPKAGPDALRADLLRQAPEILTKLVDLAKAGDVAAAREVLARCLPPLKPRDQAVTLALGSGLIEAGKAILGALEAGTLTPDQASTLAATINSLARTAELIEFEKRLSAIEVDLKNERKQT